MLIVRSVGRFGARISGRVDARGTIERVDGQPTVFAEYPMAQMPSLPDRFELGIGCERITVLDDLYCAGEIGQRLNEQAKRLEQLSQLDRLLTIVSAEDKCARHKERRAKSRELRAKSGSRITDLAGVVGADRALGDWVDGTLDIKGDAD